MDECTAAYTSPSHEVFQHRHQQESFLISEGEVVVTISGKTIKLGPGSAAFAASGDELQIQNVGTRPAQYFEVIIDAKGPTPH